MSFEDTISIPFRFWQATFITSFSIDRIPNIMPLIYHKIIFMILNIIFIGMHVIEITIYIIQESATILDSWILVTYPICLVIYAATIEINWLEAYYKRHDQQDLLLHFNRVDVILEHQIGIKIDYVAERRIHTRRLFRFLTSNVIFVMAVIYCTFWMDEFYSDWIFITHVLLYVVISLRIHQYTTIILVIERRYRLLNKCIQMVYATDLFQLRKTLTDNSGLILIDGIIFNATSFLLGRPLNKYRFISYVRNASHLLYIANRKLNRLFVLSLSIITIFEFTDLFLINYFQFEWVGRTGLLAAFFFVVARNIPHQNNIISMANSCERAIAEVSNTNKCYF